MVSTRSGAGSGTKQKTLDQLPGTTLTRKTGGGKRANERPTEEQTPKKGKTLGPASSGGTVAKRDDDGAAKQSTAADDARAIASSVDAGDSPQRKLQAATKQTGLEAAPAGERGGTGTGGGRGSGGSSKKELHVDKNEHDAAAPKRSGGGGGAATKAAKAEARSHPGKLVKINRAPVLTLWVKKVAQRQGYDEDAALTFGRAISGMLAQSKGRRLGVFEEKEKDPDQEKEKREAERADVFGMKVCAFGPPDKVRGHEFIEASTPHLSLSAEVLGMKGKVALTGAIRALGSGNKAIDPGQVRGYLERAFKDDLAAAEKALGELAESLPESEAGHRGYPTYEKFRPTVSEGAQGWGQKANLDLAFVTSLARHQ